MTGADGFVGRHLVRRLLAEGHEVTGAVRPGGASARDWFTEAEWNSVRWEPLELEDTASVRALLGRPTDAVVHLAALASGAEARNDPGLAWAVNAGGTARLADFMGQARADERQDPLFLLVSTGEVYGAGSPDRPFSERDEPRPQSPYAASKLGAEIAAAEAARRTGLRTIVARAFPHTGPGQAPLYVVPALAKRIAEARRRGEPSVRTGNLEPVRDLSDVRDVVAAYAALLTRGAPGETYNVSRGTGTAIVDIFHRLARLLDAAVTPAPDPSLLRGGDLRYLVGDSTKLRAATGWTPAYELDSTLRDLLDAQAD